MGITISNQQASEDPPGSSERSRRRFARAAITLSATVIILVACSKQAPGPTTTLEGKTPSGSVEMRQDQAAFIGSGSVGTGVLHFQGQNYPFTVGGLGVGGIGVSTIEARGDVYNLSNVVQFPGAYVQGRYGFALGTQSGGDLWLQNENGVVLHLQAKRTGLMLSLGGDAVVISMK